MSYEKYSRERKDIKNSKMLEPFGSISERFKASTPIISALDAGLNTAHNIGKRYLIVMKVDFPCSIDPVFHLDVL